MLSLYVKVKHFTKPEVSCELEMAGFPPNEPSQEMLFFSFKQGFINIHKIAEEYVFCVLDTLDSNEETPGQRIPIHQQLQSSFNDDPTKAQRDIHRSSMQINFDVILCKDDKPSV